MGVTGAGKTTVGRALADELRWLYLEADEFHSEENVAKMARGEPLTDDDRWPWLASIAKRLRALHDAGTPAVLACSALRHAYRKALRSSGADLRFVFLDVDRETARRRVADRRGHYMPPSLVDSQFEALETPRDALVVNASRPVEQIVSAVRAELAL